MTYRLCYDRLVRGQLRALPGDVRSVALKQLDALLRESRPPQAKELDDYPSHYRIWLPRNHRLVYQVLEDEQVIDLLYVGPKVSGFYAKLGLGRN